MHLAPVSSRPLTIMFWSETKDEEELTGNQVEGLQDRNLRLVTKCGGEYILLI